MTSSNAAEMEKNPIEWIQTRLREAADPGYADFTRRMLPREVESPVLGVRVGVLRQIAKDLSESARELTLRTALKGGPRRAKKQRFPNALEERLVVAFLIGRVKAPFDKRIELVDAFLPYIDSWAVCDEFCSALKWRDGDKEELLNYVTLCLARSEPYVIRFALVELLKWFVDKERVSFVIASVEELARRKITERAVQMGCAWTLCEAFIKFPETTMRYLRKNSLDDFAYNQTLQKILDSLRVDEETKEEIRAMKRKRSR